MQFIIPPQDSAVSSMTIVGGYRIIDRSIPDDAQRLNANNMAYDVSPLVGAIGLFSTSEVLKAYTLNTLDKIPQLPTVIASISLTRHATDFIAHNFGTHLDPGLRFTAGRVRGFGRSDNTVQCYHETREFCFRPFNGLFQGKKLDLKLLNGIQFQMTISRVSDVCEYFGMKGVFGINDARVFQMKRRPLPYTGAFPGWDDDDEVACSAVTALDIEITEICAYAVLEESDPNPATSFSWPTVDVYRQPRPSTTNVQLALPIGLQSVKIVDTFVMTQYDSADIAYCNLNVLSTKRSDFEATKNGKRLKFRYSTQQVSEKTRITQCTSNTIAVAGLRDNVSRADISRKVARGTFNELVFSQGNGEVFQNVTWQYRWVLRPIISAFYVPYTNFTTTDTTMRQEEYKNINAYALQMWTPNVGTQFWTFQPNTAEVAWSPTSLDRGYFPAVYNQKDIYANAKPGNNLGDVNVLTLVSTITTLSLGSDASTAEQVSTGPSGKSISTDLILDECAPPSAVVRSVQQRIVAKVLPWANPHQTLLEIRLPTSGLQTAQMYLHFRLKHAGTGIVPGTTTTYGLGPTWGNVEHHDDKLYNRLQYPSSIGNMAHLRGLFYDLPNGTTVEVAEVAQDHFLNLYGATQEATLMQTEFTNKRSDAWVIGSSNAHYTDFHHHRSYDYAGRCFDSAAPYAKGSIAPNPALKMTYTDFRLIPKTYCVNLSGIEIMEKTAGLPYLANQSRTIRVVLDHRNIGMAYQPCGIGNEAMGSFDSLAAYGVEGTDLWQGDSPNLFSSLDESFTPYLETYIAFLDSAAQAAVQNRYASEGYSYTISHFTRFNEDQSHGFTPLKMQIGGFNPDSIIVQHQHLQYTEGDVYYCPPSLNGAVGSRSAVQRFGSNAFVTCRDGMLAVSYYANTIKDLTPPSEVGAIRNLNPIYTVNIDGSSVFTYDLGSAPVNAIHYTLLRNLPIGYPDWMFSDKNRGLFRRPAIYPSTSSGDRQYAYGLSGGIRVSDIINLNAGGTVRRDMLTYHWLRLPAHITTQASRGLFFVPILPQFQNGSVLTITQSNVSLAQHTFFALNGDWKTVAAAAKVSPPHLLRTAILHCAMHIHITPTDSEIKYEYPSGKYIKA